MQSGAGFGNLILLALPLLLLGFLMFTQRRRSREVAAMQASLAVGEEVMTSAGLYGRLVGLDDEIATLEIAPGVTVRFDRRAVTRPPQRPGAGGDASDAPESPDGAGH